MTRNKTNCTLKQIWWNPFSALAVLPDYPRLCVQNIDSTLGIREIYVGYERAATDLEDWTLRMDLVATLDSCEVYREKLVWRRRLYDGQTDLDFMFYNFPVVPIAAFAAGQTTLQSVAAPFLGGLTCGGQPFVRVFNADKLFFDVIQFDSTMPDDLWSFNLKCVSMSAFPTNIGQMT